MLRFLADENLKGDVVRGVFRRQPDIDLVRIQDVGLVGADDRVSLAWAAEQERIVSSHDRATMPEQAFARVATGLPMPGLFIVPSQLSVRQAIDEILLIATCSDEYEWTGRVLYLPP